MAGLKNLDAFADRLDDSSFGLVEALLKFVVPIKFGFGRQEGPEGGNHISRS